jgi:hypothetical protein
LYENVSPEKFPVRMLALALREQLLKPSARNSAPKGSGLQRKRPAKKAACKESGLQRKQPAKKTTCKEKRPRIAPGPSFVLHAG